MQFYEDQVAKDVFLQVFVAFSELLLSFDQVYIFAKLLNVLGMLDILFAFNNATFVSIKYFMFLA